MKKIILSSITLLIIVISILGITYSKEITTSLKFDLIGPNPLELEVYNEYSVSRVVSNASLDGYHEVDSGTEVVTGKFGQVDVDVMERAVFHEYEDSTEEMIISIERWEDGEEISAGYYLDADDIRCLHKDSSESITGFFLSVSYFIFGNTFGIISSLSQ